MTKKSQSPFLIEISAALGNLRVKETFIKGAPGEIVYGLQEGKAIWINPVPAIVETVLHEVIHAVRPEWSERTVRAQTTKLFLRLSPEEMQAIYRVYQERL